MTIQTASVEPKEVVLKGLSGSPGICIGAAYLVDAEGVDVVEKYYIRHDRIEQEISRFKTAVEKAKAELRSIIADLPEEYRQHASILETHVVLLKDKMLYGKAIDTIETERVNAEWALKKVVSNLKHVFRKMTDPYLRERGDDVMHAADRIMQNLTGMERVNIASIDKRVILVAHNLSPAETSQIQLERIKGFALDRGGVASHTGIIAQTLGIPAVLGLENATRYIRNDDIIIVDGSEGLVILHPTEQTLFAFEEKKARYEETRAVIARSSHLPAETTDKVRVSVMGNIELPEEVVSVLDMGGDGIGLYRTEFQYMSRRIFPSEDELFENYKTVAEVASPRPVTIRTLDINGDKAVAYDAQRDEVNPALGLRAIRYCLQKPEVFMTQLRAILRAAAFGNVRILLPMISSIEEVKAARRLMEQASESLEREGHLTFGEVEVGIMIEVPSAVVIADILAEAVDFFSIGTNDLIQYSLAIDRGNRQVAHLYNPLHPAILRMVNHVSEVGRRKGIKTFMCGEMAGDPLHTPILLGFGLDELSMNPRSIPEVKRMIRSVSVGEAQTFAKEVLRQGSAEDVEKLIHEAYGAVLTEEVLPS